jgi:hypothetical protein
MGGNTRGIAAVNSGVFFVVPIHDLEPLLSGAGYPYQPPTLTPMEDRLPVA